MPIKQINAIRTASEPLLKSVITHVSKGKGTERLSKDVFELSSKTKPAKTWAEAIAKFLKITLPKHSKKATTETIDTKFSKIIADKSKMIAEDSAKKIKNVTDDIALKSKKISKKIKKKIKTKKGFNKFNNNEIITPTTKLKVAKKGVSAAKLAQKREETWKLTQKLLERKYASLQKTFAKASTETLDTLSQIYAKSMTKNGHGARKILNLFSGENAKELMALYNKIEAKDGALARKLLNMMNSDNAKDLLTLFRKAEIEGDAISLNVLKSLTPDNAAYVGKVMKNIKKDNAFYILEMFKNAGCGDAFAQKILNNTTKKNAQSILDTYRLVNADNQKALLGLFQEAEEGSKIASRLNAAIKANVTSKGENSNKIELLLDNLGTKAEYTVYKGVG